MDYSLVDRKEVPQEFKWDIDTIYPDEVNLKQDIEKLRGMIEEIKNFKGKFRDGAKYLYECLKIRDEAGRLCDKITVFCFMKRDEDNNNTKGQELADIGERISVEFGSATAFIYPEILSLEEGTIDRYFKEVEELKLYSHELDDLIRQKKHVLSDKEEELLSKTAEMSLGYENVFKMLSFADLKFDKIKDSSGKEFDLTINNFSQFIVSKDRELRKNAFLSLHRGFMKYKNTYGALLSSKIKSDVFYSSVRGFKSFLEAALFSDNIDVNLYHKLIDIVSENIIHLDELMKLKKKELKLDELHLYDLYVPIVESVDMEVKYDEAKEMVKEGLNILGDEYLKVLDEAFNNKWIDVYSNKGKYSGAYSWGAYDTKPYILLNYNNRLDDVLTLAHELGHSIHSYFSRKTQPYVYSNYTIFCAEVASTTNEVLMYFYLMDKLKGEARRYIISEFMELIRTTYYRQVLFAEFELITHTMVEKGEPLNGEKLSEIWMNLYKKYYGRECVIDEEINIEWARIPHFYDGYYVYKYATGLSAGISIAKSILDDKKNVDRYLNFLKSGGSKYSLELLKDAGVDMLSGKPISDTAEVLRYLIKECHSSEM
ncbi:oligoendopeptidase F [Thermobrachium celere]|uniref:oligoendopeptidase F n=1 Tax=Thermobrachium celere TaxID=53422 RepID=UPI001944A8D4|nr:oligoendopeptidase F [Thermobrachium celere]GFR36112.1 oligoendopeptidase F [Thermobrachium celere]